MGSMIVESADMGNLSHAKRGPSLERAIEGITAKITARGDLSYASVARQLELVEQLAASDFGRFLLERGGLNGYWTHAVITHPRTGRLTGVNPQGHRFSGIEDFLLNQAPVCLATQQRFEIFKEEIQKRVFEGCALASIPCGLMGDFLELDYSAARNFSLTGIDLDREALAQAQQIAELRGLDEQCVFLQKDAWHLGVSEEFTLITSNGLTIYEPDDAQVVALYREFFQGLKPGGCLIASFLTPPAEWSAERVNAQDALMQKLLFADILECKWQVFRAEAVVRDQLLQAGFSEIEIVYDPAHIFPTAVAKKAAS